MVIPLVGRLNPASGKEGLLPECCWGNLYAKQTAQKLSKTTRTNIGLCHLRTQADTQVCLMENYFHNLLWSSAWCRWRPQRARGCNQPAADSIHTDLRCKTWPEQEVPIQRPPAAVLSSFSSQSKAQYRCSVLCLPQTKTEQKTEPVESQSSVKGENTIYLLLQVSLLD